MGCANNIIVPPPRGRLRKLKHPESLRRRWRKHLELHHDFKESCIWSCAAHRSSRRLSCSSGRGGQLEPNIKPILPPLLEAIRRTPIGLQSLLVTSFGKPYMHVGLGEWCNEAGLPECSSHGLKKAAATICANMGRPIGAHGAVRLAEREAGERLHAEGQQDEARSWRLLGQFFGVAADTARTG
jgi:hypothetical protein